MKSTLTLRAFLLTGLVFAATAKLSAQDLDFAPPAQATPMTQDYASNTTPYVQPTEPVYEAKPQTIQQMNAQTRGQQRQLRLASMQWYGMSNSRPTVSPTPFSSIYSPVWQMPGGRPFAWYSYNRPTTYLIYR
jgi:hypothetical protein